MFFIKAQVDGASLQANKPAGVLVVEYTQNFPLAQ